MHHAISELIILLFQLSCFVWPILSLATLAALRRRLLATLSQALWALIIVVIPILGACAFWIVQPGEK